MTTDAKHHNTIVTVSEYLAILSENYLDRIYDVVSHRYVGKPSGNEDRAVERNYKQRKQDLYRYFICTDCVKEREKEAIRYRFHKKVAFYITQFWVDENKIIKYPRILIWSTYLICWVYI